MTFKLIMVALINIANSKENVISLKCVDGTLKLKQSQWKEMVTIPYCHSEDFTVLVSKDCYKDGKVTCLKNVKLDKNILKSDMPQIGKPGFKICKAIGGTPELIDFMANGKWQPLDRCNLKGTRSFIDTGLLTIELSKQFKD